MLCWCHYEQTGAVMKPCARETAEWATVLRAPFESQGADVRELSTTPVIVLSHLSRGDYKLFYVCLNR